MSDRQRTARRDHRVGDADGGDGDGRLGRAVHVPHLARGESGPAAPAPRRPGGVSPQKRNRRSAGSMSCPKRGSARQKRANDGVDTQAVRGAPSRRRKRRRGSSSSVAVDGEAGAAGEERAVEVHHGEVEAEGRLVEEGLRRPGRTRWVASSQSAKWRRARCGIGHALRVAGRARREDDVRTALRDRRGRDAAGAIECAERDARRQRIERRWSRSLARPAPRASAGGRLLREHRVGRPRRRQHADDPSRAARSDRPARRAARRAAPPRCRRPSPAACARRGAPGLCRAPRRAARRSARSTSSA